MSEQVILAIVAGIVAITLALIAYKQAQLHADVRKIREDVNGHTKLLLAATKAEATETGKAAGVAQERARKETR